jgi:hypothetical protein
MGRQVGKLENISNTLPQEQSVPQYRKKDDGVSKGAKKGFPRLRRNLLNILLHSEKGSSFSFLPNRTVFAVGGETSKLWKECRIFKGRDESERQQNSFENEGK